MDPVIAVLAVVMMLLGLVGAVIPVVPGLPVVWVASVGTTLWVETDVVGWAVSGVLTLMFAAGTAATVWLPARQGRRGGAPASSLVAALVGALVGFVVIPVVGFLLGAFGAFLLAEQRRMGDWQPAFASLRQMVRAYGIGVLVEVAIGVAMIATWAVAAVLR